MALKIMDLFESIKWAKNGDVTDMSQTNYEAGWSHLGDDTPTVEDFNLVQKLNDEKDQWLFNQIKAVCDAKGIEVAESDKQALLKAINTSATLSIAGITQLSSALDSTLETMAATPKAIKTLKDLIDAITRNLGNYIHNSKKSNAVDSGSEDTVATSVAVKTANDNANGRVSKDGDTMTGPLDINAPDTFVRFKRNDGNIGFVGAPYATSENIKLHSYKHGTFFELQEEQAYINKALELAGDIVVKSGEYSAVRTFNTANQEVRWESAPNKDHYYAAVVGAVKNSVVYKVMFPKKIGTTVLDTEFTIDGGANSYVKKDGAGDLNARCFRNTYQNESRIQGAIAFRINNSTDNYTRFCDNPDAVMSWLKADKLITESMYPSHYDGAKVLKLEVVRGAGWKFIQMKSTNTSPTDGEIILNLPEAITMDSVINVSDNGELRYSYGAKMISQTQIKVFAPAGKKVGLNIQIMGGGSW